MPIKFLSTQILHSTHVAERWEGKENWVTVSRAQVMGLSQDSFRDGEILLSVIQLHLLFGFFLNVLLIPQTPIMEKKTKVQFSFSLWYYSDSSALLATLFLFSFPRIFSDTFSIWLSPWPEPLPVLLGLLILVCPGSAVPNPLSSQICLVCLKSAF